MHMCKQNKKLYAIWKRAGILPNVFFYPWTWYVSPFYLGIIFFNHHFVNRQQGTCFNRFASIFVIIFTAGGLLYFTLWFPLVHCQSIAILLVLYFAMVMKLYACSRICFIDSMSFSMYTIMPSASNYIYFFYSSPLICMFPPVTSPAELHGSEVPEWRGTIPVLGDIRCLS